jgi:thiaminase/transcriptional activator TenA
MSVTSKPHRVDVTRNTSAQRQRKAIRRKLHLEFVSGAQNLPTYGTAIVAVVPVVVSVAIAGCVGSSRVSQDTYSQINTAVDDSTMRFTDELRLAAGDQWHRVVNHRFTTELADGSIDRQVLTRYLIQDYRFLDSFVVLLASIVARSRSLADRIPACQFLAVITGDENTYFERSFEKLGVTCEQREESTVPNAPCTAGFCKLMREVAYSGSLSEMLAVIVVCEWSYMCWGERVLSKTNREDFVTYEWVDLHAGDYFQGVVEYLRGLLDKEGATMLDEAGRAACQRRFLQTVQLEEEFFDFAYSTDELGS